MRNAIVTGMALSLFAVAMTASSPAHAYPTPGLRCTSANAGASATTSYNDGYSTYYYTYICNPNAWVLADVLQCNNATGTCAHW
jgi:hypothetical protein